MPSQSHPAERPPTIRAGDGFWTADRAVANELVEIHPKLQMNDLL
jgi:hypothetical protein